MSFISIKEYAEIKNINYETLKRQCQTGKIKNAKKIAYRWFIFLDEDESLNDTQGPRN